MGSLLQVDSAEDLPWSIGQAGEHPGSGKMERATMYSALCSLLPSTYLSPSPVSDRQLAYISSNSMKTFTVQV